MSSSLSKRQIEIIEVAIDLIAEKGIQGLTIKNLAKKIGFSESAIYRHFENKIQIIIGALNHFQNIAEKFFDVELDREADAKEKIANMFFNYFQTFSQYPAIVAVVFSEEIFRNETVLLERVSELMKVNSSKFIEIIEKGQHKGEIRNDVISSHLVLVIFGALRMYVSEWHLEKHSFDIMKKGQEFVQSVISLISP